MENILTDGTFKATEWWEEFSVNWLSNDVQNYQIYASLIEKEEQMGLKIQIESIKLFDSIF